MCKIFKMHKKRKKEMGWKGKNRKKNRRKTCKPVNTNIEKII